MTDRTENAVFTPDPALYPFESRWFTSSKGKLHYVDEGHGPTLVFFHGNPNWSFAYRNIIRRLSPRFRCVAVDYLGFGLSERPAGFGYTATEHMQSVGELVDHLGLDAFVTVGQDWGGPISMGVALSRAERVTGVVLGNTWIGRSDARRLRLFARVMSSPPFQYLILHRGLMVTQSVKLGVGRPLTPEEIKHYEAVQQTPEARRGSAVFPKQILAASPMLEQLGRDVAQRLGHLPALFPWGMSDPGFPADASLPRLRATFPDNVVLELPGAGHLAVEDAPGKIADAIADRFDWQASRSSD